MIVVTGATGQLGKRILERLLDLVPADQLGASARDPAKAGDLAKRGVRVRHGDFAEPDSLAAAFEGASQLLMVSSNAEAYGGDTRAQCRAAIEAAQTAGVRRIVYTSHMAASASSAFSPMHSHAAAEAMLRASGVAWTALRNGFYASIVPTIVGRASASGVIATPRDGEVSWTTHDDLATAAAHVLMQEGRFDGPTPPLTASEALNFDDVAAILTDLHGRPVRHEIIADEAASRQMIAEGLPPVAAKIRLDMYQAARAGEFASVDPLLEQLLARPSIKLREVLAG